MLKYENGRLYMKVDKPSGDDTKNNRTTSDTSSSSPVSSNNETFKFENGRIYMKSNFDGGSTSKGSSNYSNYLKSIKKSETSTAVTNNNYQKPAEDDEEIRKFLIDTMTRSLNGEDVSDVNLDDIRYNINKQNRKTLDLYDPETSENDVNQYMDKYNSEVENGTDLLSSITPKTSKPSRYSYSGVLRNDDYSENSEYKSSYRGGEYRDPLSGYMFDTGYDDIEHDIINGDEQALLYYNANNQDNYGATKNYLKYISDEEKGIYNYLYNTKGKDTANKYIDAIKSDLYSRQTNADASYIKETTKDNTVLYGLASHFLAIPETFENIYTNLNSLLGNEIDTNSDLGGRFTQIRKSMEGSLEENAKEQGAIAHGLYTVQHAVGDYAFQVFMGSGFGTAIAASTASQEMIFSAKERGLSDDQAMTLGTITGVIAGALRYGMFKGIEKNLSTDYVMDLPKYIANYKYVLKTAGDFAAKSAIIDTLNYIADICVAGDKSKLELSVKNNIAMGMDRTEAYAKAIGQQILDTLGNAAKSAFSGALIAEFMSLGISYKRTPIEDPSRLLEDGSTNDASTEEALKRIASNMYDNNEQDPTTKLLPPSESTETNELSPVDNTIDVVDTNEIAPIDNTIPNKPIVDSTSNNGEVFVPDPIIENNNNPLTEVNDNTEIKPTTDIGIDESEDIPFPKTDSSSSSNSPVTKGYDAAAELKKIQEATKDRTPEEWNTISEGYILSILSGVEGSRKRVYKFFKENPDKNERAKFLKKEFGVGGYCSTGINVLSGSKGVEIQYGDTHNNSPSFKKVYPYKYIETLIDNAINNGTFFDFEGKISDYVNIALGRMKLSDLKDYYDDYDEEDDDVERILNEASADLGEIGRQQFMKFYTPNIDLDKYIVKAREFYLAGFSGKLYTSLPNDGLTSANDLNFAQRMALFEAGKQDAQKLSNNNINKGDAEDEIKVDGLPNTKGVHETSVPVNSDSGLLDDGKTKNVPGTKTAGEISGNSDRDGNETIRSDGRYDAERGELRSGSGSSKGSDLQLEKINNRISVNFSEKIKEKYIPDVIKNFLNEVDELFADFSNRENPVVKVHREEYGNPTVHSVDFYYVTSDEKVANKKIPEDIMKNISEKYNNKNGIECVIIKDSSNIINRTENDVKAKYNVLINWNVKSFYDEKKNKIHEQYLKENNLFEITPSLQVKSLNGLNSIPQTVKDVIENVHQRLISYDVPEKKFYYKDGKIHLYVKYSTGKIDEKHLETALDESFILNDEEYKKEMGSYNDYSRNLIKKAKNKMKSFDVNFKKSKEDFDLIYEVDYEWIDKSFKPTETYEKVNNSNDEPTKLKNTEHVLELDTSGKVVLETKDNIKIPDDVHYLFDTLFGDVFYLYDVTDDYNIKTTKYSTSISLNFETKYENLKNSESIDQLFNGNLYFAGLETLRNDINYYKAHGIKINVVNTTKKNKKEGVYRSYKVDVSWVNENIDSDNEVVPKNGETVTYEINKRLSFNSNMKMAEDMKDIILKVDQLFDECSILSKSFSYYDILKVDQTTKGQKVVINYTSEEELDETIYDNIDIINDEFSDKNLEVDMFDDEYNGKNLYRVAIYWTTPNHGPKKNTKYIKGKQTGEVSVSENESSTSEENEIKYIEENEIKTKTDIATQEKPKGNNFVIDNDFSFPTTPVARYNANIEAIKLIKKLDSENRVATPDEQVILSKYTGWGGLTNVFTDNSKISELKKYLTDEEFKSAESTILDAYYTDTNIIKAIYKGLDNIGFNGGRILEPSMGIGRFVGSMPKEMQNKVTSSIGVEIDNISGSISKYLYPNTDVRIQPFEKALIPQNYMNLVVGNVPFGNVRIYDPEYPNYITSNIHNYFIAKSIDSTAPGGITCLITTKGTLDSNNAQARTYYAEKADLIGAIRLPNSAFKGTGTGVVSDILVFKKRLPSEQYSGEKFIKNTAVVSDKVWFGKNYSVNEYFAEHPDMVLGEYSVGTRNVRDFLDVVARENENIDDEIVKAFSKITEKFDYNKKPVVVQEKKPKKVCGKLYKKGQNIVRIDSKGNETNVDLKEKEKPIVEGILWIRDAARDLLDMQQNGEDESKINAKRKELNEAYDGFVKRNGPLHKKTNKNLVDMDADGPFILSLENYDKNNKTADKNTIFTKNVVSKRGSNVSVSDVNEGIIASMNTLGRIDIDNIASMLGKTVSEVEKEIIDNGYAFKTGEKEYQIPEIYLSGNVRAKLKNAEAMAKLNPKYNVNVEALKNVIPEDIKPEDINVSIGSTWIPEAIYSKFAAHILGISEKNRYGSGYSVEVIYNSSSSSFEVNLKDYSAYRNPNNTNKWGTEDRRFIGKENDLFMSLLNNKEIKVVRSSNGVSRIDDNATEIALKKAENLKIEFRKWLWSDEERCKTLGRMYNDIFNNTVVPKYDGSHLTIDGLAEGFKLKTHQANAVQRIIYNGGNTLLAHRVGAGKTLEMASAAMKLRQLGIVKKPVIVVPKHLLAQWGNEFRNYYPNSKIYVVGENDFTREKKKESIAKIATGDYDAIIIHYQNFKAIPLSVEYQKSFFDKQIKIIDEFLSNMGKFDKSYTKRQLENTRKNLIVKIEKFMNKSEKYIDTLSFEELGIDSLFVDEAHNFKNLYYFTGMHGISDIGDMEGSDQAFDMYMKTRYLHELNGGRGLVFATATPIMNSLAEAYTMQRYLQEDLLESKGLSTFDAWAKQFGDPVAVIKMKTAGKGYEIKQSMSKYKNLPEFMQMWGLMADVIIDPKDLPEIKIPKMKGGKRIIVECDPSDFQLNYMNELDLRYKNVKNNEEDHIFKIMNDGKSVSYSQKLIDPSLPIEPNGKIVKAVENVVDVYKRTSKEKGTQLIFCDRGVPGGIDDIRGANLYSEMKNLLIAYGIPQEEIEFIHDSDTDTQKTTLFKKVNNGSVRVLIGSTKKMGTGVNVQERMAAIHELNPVDRPGDLEQNEGRALRQGNMYDEVECYVYVTKRTFDSPQWDRIKRKSSFINQIMSGSVTSREADGDDDLTLSAAEISSIASGNPLILELFTINDKISKLEILESSHIKEVKKARNAIEQNKKDIPYLKESLKKAESDLSRKKDISGDNYKIIINGKTFTNETKKESGEELFKTVKEKLNITRVDEERFKIGSFAGFDLYVSSKGNMCLQGELQYSTEANLASISGNLTRLIELVDIRICKERIEERKLNIESRENDDAKYREIVNSEFEEKDELIELKLRAEEIYKKLENSGTDTDELDSIIETKNFIAPSIPEEWEAERDGEQKNQKDMLSLSEIISKIEHDLEINITRGHVRGKKNKLGQFNTRDKGIRYRVANDIATASHELGHAIDDMFDITKNIKKIPKDVMDEIEQIFEDSHLAKDEYKEKEIPGEGLAEYFKMYFNHRSSTVSKYPKLTEFVFSKIPGRYADRINSISDLINAYYSQDADTAQSNLRPSEYKSHDFRTIDEKLEDGFTDIYQKAVDKNYSIKKNSNKAYVYATNSAYADKISANIIQNELSDISGQYVGRSLRDILYPINVSDKNEYALFNEYLVMLHGKERIENDLQVFADPRKDNVDFMVRRARELEEQYPKFKQVALDIIEFEDKFIQKWAVETGIISTDQYAAWKKKYKFHVPFNRVHDITNIKKGTKKGYGSQNSPFKKAKGSGLDIVYPVDNIINEVINVVNISLKNRVMVELRNEAIKKDTEITALVMEKIPESKVPIYVSTAKIKHSIRSQAKEAFEDGLIDEFDYNNIDEFLEDTDDMQLQFIKGYADPNKGIVTVIINGKKEWWKINDKLLLDSIINLNPYRLPFLLEVYGATTRFVTSMITGNNAIWSIFSNAPRDLMTMATYNKFKSKPISTLKNIGVSYLNNLMSHTKKGSPNPYFREYLAMGGGKPSLFSSDINAAKKARKAIKNKTSQKLLSAVNPMNVISFISDTIEMGPRAAAYIMCREAGMSTEDAFYNSQEITVNFSKRGSSTRGINSIVPFFNASVQGIDRFIRYLTAEDVGGPGGTVPPKGPKGPNGNYEEFDAGKKPSKAEIKEQRTKVMISRLIGYTLVCMLLGSIIYTINNLDEESSDDYEQLSNYTKNSYWVIPLGNGKYFAIPKPREIAVLSSSFERILEEYYGGNKNANDEFAEYALDNFFPSIISDIFKAPINISEDGLDQGMLNTIEDTIGDLGILGTSFNIVANRDFLGRPIVSSTLSKLPPEQQYSDTTSWIAKNIGEMLQISPIRVDYFLSQTIGAIYKPIKSLTPVNESKTDYSLGVGNTYIKDNVYSQDIVNRLFDQQEKSSIDKQRYSTDKDIEISNKMDTNMTTFYGRFNSLNRNNTSVEDQRELRQNVIELINEYLNYDYNNASSEVKLMYRLAEDYGTTVLPAVMETYIKSSDGTKYELNDAEYYEYQTKYNAYYYDYIESTYTSKMTSKEQLAMVKKAKEVAKKKTDNEILLKYKKTKANEFFDKYDGISDKDLIRSLAMKSLQEKDTKVEYIESLNKLIDNNLISESTASKLFDIYFKTGNPFS